MTSDDHLNLFLGVIHLVFVFIFFFFCLKSELEAFWGASGLLFKCLVTMENNFWCMIGFSKG